MDGSYYDDTADCSSELEKTAPSSGDSSASCKVLLGLAGDTDTDSSLLSEGSSTAGGRRVWGTRQIFDVFGQEAIFETFEAAEVSGSLSS